MPKSKAQLRWAYAHAKDKGKTGDAAREMIQAHPSPSGLPARAKKKKKAK